MAPNERTIRIPLLVPDMPTADEVAPYLKRIDGSRWYTNFGPLIGELEARLAAIHASTTPSPIAVQTVANATLGIELALTALRLRPGSRILVPAVTFTATAAAVVRSGHIPVISDVDAESWLLTPQIARQAIGRSELAAVLPVCTYGCPQDVAGWDNFSRQTGIRVLIDAAGAFGNQHNVGQACIVFSLHATKSLGAGEGGFVVACDAATILEVKRLSNFGLDLTTGYALSVGTNAKLSEYHAAVALAALDRWEERGAHRALLHRRYLQALERHCPGLTLQRRPANGLYTIMPVLLPSGSKSVQVAASLAKSGIETRRWYCPTLERHPAYGAFPVAGPLDVAAQLNDRLLGLPFFPALSDEDIITICAGLAKALIGS